MADWPEHPKPNSTVMLAPLRQVSAFQADSGFQIRRLRGTRERRRFQLTYLGLNWYEVNILSWFMNVILQNGTVPFKWVPRADNSTKIADINSGVANTFPYIHPLRVGQHVQIDHSGAYSSSLAYEVETTPTATHFSIRNQTASDFSNNMRWRHALPNAYITLTGDGEVPSPTKQLGPLRDDKGLFSYVIEIVEA